MFKNISPSKMPRIVNCPGSVNLCNQFPELSDNDSNEITKQGILASWLVKQKLVREIDPWRYLNKSPINDQIVDREMVTHVLNYCEITEKIGKGEIKRRYEIKIGVFKSFNGIPDFVFYDKSLESLTILVFKYGFIPVSVIRNWQLLSYAWLFTKVNPDKPLSKIKLNIYQPRISTKEGVLKTQVIDIDVCNSIFFPRIEDTLRSFQSSTSMTRSGDHCHHCSAMLQCNTNLETCLRIVNLGNVQHAEEPTGEQLSNQLKLFQFSSKILEKRLQVIESIAEHRLKSGEQLPGYCLISSQGNRYWDISKSRGELIGIPMQTSKFMTPKQAEINGFPQSLIKKYSKIKTSVKLTEFNIQEVEELLKNG